MADKIFVRPAAKADSRHIAQLVAIASDGLAEYIWSKQAAEGENLIDIGASRYARENESFSYENAFIAEVNGKVAGMALGYYMGESDDGDLGGIDPVLRPYAQLEDPNSLYISDIAVYGAFRGMGLGTKLLAVMHAKARYMGPRKASLICFEENQRALRLYKEHGYVEIDRRPIVPHPSLKRKTGDALLMRRAA